MDLQKIEVAMAMLREVQFPDGYIADLECAVINAHLDATKAARARHLLATRGRREAAFVLGCSESQVYRLAHVRTIRQGFPANSADLENEGGACAAG